MNKINIPSSYILAFALTFTVFACKDEDPTVEDHMLNFEIEEIPATEDYLVGAMYFEQSDWNANNYEQPTIGQYGEGQPLSSADAMQQHINQASEYGVDFFLFDFNVIQDSLSNIYTDSNTVANILLASSNAGSINFALKFNFGFLGLNANNRMQANDSLFERFVTAFKYMIPYFQASNYQKVENRCLVYLSNASDLLCDSSGNAPVYTELRSRMSAEGIDLYIVGEQPRWTPSPRYETRFKDCVDAVSLSDMIFTTEYQTMLYFPQYAYLNWEYNREYIESNWNVDFVPQIQPAFTERVTNPSSTVFDFEGTEEFFRTYCNVAKAHCNENRLVLINSFNDWTRNTQLEPSVEKSTLYLEIMNDEFKVD